MIDTLVQAKEMHPGKRNSLDALCDRYGISNAHRALHGALLDAELLAEVYLAMTRGQNSLSMDLGASDVDSDGQVLEVVAIAPVQLLLASEEEMAAHAAMVESLDKQVKGQSVWRCLLYTSDAADE